MNNTALQRLLEERKLHNDYVDCFGLQYSNYDICYTGSYFGYVCQSDAPSTTEHEYTWQSFEEMLDDTIEEVGKTWREVLEETSPDKLFVAW